MKRKFLFLLFVIGLMTIAPHALIAQTIDSVEEHSIIIDQKKVGNTIRFTLEVERDSALCSPALQTGECYVISKKIKKYLYVDISRSPHISQEIAQKAFLSPWILQQATEGTSFADFKEIKTVDTYSGFPWVTKVTLEPKGYYYFYNSRMLIFDQETKINLTKGVAGWIIFFWFCFFATLTIGIAGLSRSFFDIFEECTWFTRILALIIQLVIFSNTFIASNEILLYPIFYVGILTITFFSLQFVLGQFWQHWNNTKITWIALFNFLVISTSFLSMLFWMVDKVFLCYLLIPLSLITIFLPPLVGFIKSKRRKEVIAI